MSARQLRLILREVKRRAKKEGKTIIGGLLDVFYSDETSATLKIQAGKLILDKTLIQVSEGGEADRNLGPAFFLPEKHPRLKSIDGGKSA
ncbi:MAG TPA: hypothetical protein VFU31_19650 [Candidatus Binatia bacterium]|nr:hypothetical protein [Candidatus Binatia bacterium]